MREAEVEPRLREAGCVFVEEESRLLLDQFPEGATLEKAVRRRVAGEPLEHVLGHARFCNLRIDVQPGVFVPRRRAEPLARAAVCAVRARPPGATVLDLGCGAGGIAATVAEGVESAQVWASDVSERAVRCARVNAERFGYKVVLSDWWADLPHDLVRSLDVVAAYLPHVPDERVHEVPADYRRAEDERALRGGRDGLDALRAVLPDLGRWLAPQGVFVTLLAHEQLPTAAALVARHGWGVATRAVGDSTIVSLRRGATWGVRQ